MSKPAILLLAHGSPDPDWVRPVAATQAALQRLTPSHAVVVATLSTDTSDSLESRLAALVYEGHDPVHVLSLFLSAGGRHVKHDIPTRVAALRAVFPATTITLAPGALGDDPGVTDALARAAVTALAER